LAARFLGGLNALRAGLASPLGCERSALGADLTVKRGGGAVILVLG
jgi:hypothetical protein